MTTSRVDIIRQIAAKNFWGDMARKPEDREPLDDEQWNSLFISCLVNRAIKWEFAMSLNAEMKLRTGYTDTLRMYTELSPAMIEWVMFDDDGDYADTSRTNGVGRNGSLHRYRYMADYCHQAMCRIRDEWGGSAASLHADEPNGQQFLRRVMSFKGYGEKTSGLYCRLAVLSHGAVLWNMYAGLDISPDRHIIKVMTRLGLVAEDSTPRDIINKARELSPYAPVEWDGLFITGLDYCHANDPECSKCPFALVRACPSRR